MKNLNDITSLQELCDIAEQEDTCPACGVAWTLVSDLPTERVHKDDCVFIIATSLADEIGLGIEDTMLDLQGEIDINPDDVVHEITKSMLTGQPKDIARLVAEHVGLYDLVDRPDDHAPYCPARAAQQFNMVPCVCWQDQR